MVKHIILWQLKDDIADKESVKKGIKENLESLVGKVPGLLKVNVVIDGLESSNADVMLDCELDSEESLKGYQKHPAHVAVADRRSPAFHACTGKRPAYKCYYCSTSLRRFNSRWVYRNRIGKR